MMADSLFECPSEEVFCNKWKEPNLTFAGRTTGESDTFITPAIIWPNLSGRTATNFQGRSWVFLRNKELALNTPSCKGRRESSTFGQRNLTKEMDLAGTLTFRKTYTAPFADSTGVPAGDEKRGTFFPIS